MALKILCELFLSFTFLKFSVAIDILRLNQTIGIGQTLVSENQVFELGIFPPGESPNRYLGIWYKSIPDTVAWVANRNLPITNSDGVTFGVFGNGNLALTGGGAIIWWANSTAAASNPFLRLLDTGNLVVGDNQMEGYLWQSFDYPTDTWLPGMKVTDEKDGGEDKYLTSWRNSDDPSPGDFVFRIQNQGLPELVVLNGTTKMFRTGKWNGRYFNGSPRFPNPVLKPDVVFDPEDPNRLLYMVRTYNNSTVTRSTLDASGKVQRRTMNAGKNKWNLVLEFPVDQCDEYSFCGPNGMCKHDEAQRCVCLRGYAPKSKSDWELQGYSGGCNRTTALNCDIGDGFLEVKAVKYPDMLSFKLNMSMSLDECKAECLRNCNCTACANPYITDGGSGCVMWFGDLVDIREFAEADSMENIYLRLPNSLIDKSTGPEKEKRSSMKLILILIASAVFLLCCIRGGALLLSRRKKLVSKSNNKDLDLPIFKLDTIMAATDGFSMKNIIGEGGFGPVYKGKLCGVGEIAVKRLSRTSGQGLEEFKNEVILIAKLQHINLVRLLGCCIEGEEIMLIYEYLKNKSLDNFVFDKNRRTVLTWPKRFDIIMGIARGLLYLHHDSRLKIIHRDLKTSNILLDGNLTPKISDFGLARIFEEDQPIDKTRRVVGTYGYMAPEYAIDGKFSVKSDIFSFGVLLLEVVSGQKNRGFGHCDHHHSLLGHAWLLWNEDRIMELMDDCLDDSLIESQATRCIQVGLLCVQKFAKDRPEMSSVLFMLGSDGTVLPQPKEPGFFMERSSSSVSRTFPCTETENEEFSITVVEGR